MRLPDQQLLGHVIHEQGAHAEVGDLLPHIGQEEDRKAARLTEPGLLPGRRGGAGHAAIIASAPQTLSSQNTMPSRYSPPGVRSCLRNVGPSRSTMSHSCPSTKPGASGCSISETFAACIAATKGARSAMPKP